MVVREIFRVPMGIFDSYRALCFTTPRAMNFYMMTVGWVAMLFFGKGMEKIAIRGSEHTRYEGYRRARRFYIPYFLASYKFRFPVNHK